MLTWYCRFYNRYYASTYGTQAGTWLLSQVKSIAAANSAITVSTFTHSFNQPSIIVKIPGTSTNLGKLSHDFPSVRSCINAAMQLSSVRTMTLLEARPLHVVQVLMTTVPEW
jgi:hypothetical protein